MLLSVSFKYWGWRFKSYAEALSLVNFGQWRNKWFNDPISKLQLQIEIIVSKKICLKFCSLKWLRPTRRRMRKNESFWMADVKNIITTRSYKFQNLFLKNKTWRRVTNINIKLIPFNYWWWKKKELRKKLFLTLNWGIPNLWLFLLWYVLLFEEIKSNKYFENCSFTIF